MLKKILISGILVFQYLSVFACPVCDKKQPQLLKGISHGTGPQSNWDYIIVWGTVGIVLITLVYTIKMLAAPKEKNDEHIKRRILDF